MLIRNNYLSAYFKMEITIHEIDAIYSIFEKIYLYKVISI